MAELGQDGIGARIDPILHSQHEIGGLRSGTLVLRNREALWETGIGIRIPGRNAALAATVGIPLEISAEAVAVIAHPFVGGVNAAVVLHLQLHSYLVAGVEIEAQRPCDYRFEPDGRRRKNFVSLVAGGQQQDGGRKDCCLFHIYSIFRIHIRKIFRP